MLADSGITNEYKWIIMPAEIIVKTEKTVIKRGILLMIMKGKKKGRSCYKKEI